MGRPVSGSMNLKANAKSMSDIREVPFGVSAGPAVGAGGGPGLGWWIQNGASVSAVSVSMRSAAISISRWVRVSVMSFSVRWLLCAGCQRWGGGH